MMMALLAETCCPVYPIIYVACMTDFEKYTWKHNEHVSSKIVYFYLYEKQNNLEVSGIEQGEQQPVQNSA